MTVDARLQKGFTVGGRAAVTAILDAYNLVQPVRSKSRSSPSPAPRRG